MRGRNHSKTPDRITIDRAALRDKVDFVDPAAAPLETDSEAAGTPHPAEAARTDAVQERIAEAAVPEPDASRVGSRSEQPWARRQRVRIGAGVAVALAATAALVAVLAWLTV